MGAILTKKLPSFEGVAPGQTATLRLPAGHTYHGLLIAFSGTAIDTDDLDAVRVYANGKLIQTFDGEKLDAINQYDGLADATTNKILRVPFERVGLVTRINREATAIAFPGRNNPQPINNMTVEVDIAATADASVALTAKAMVSPARDFKGNVPTIMEVRKFGYDPGGSGEFEISDLPRVGAISRIVFDSPSATINSILVELDGFEYFNRTKAENEAVQADGVRTPQAGLYVFDTTEQGYGDDAIVLKRPDGMDAVNDFRITLDMAGAGHVDAIVYYLKPLGR